MNEFEIRQLTIRNCTMVEDTDNCQAFVEQCVAQRDQGAQQYVLPYYIPGTYYTGKHNAFSFLECLQLSAANADGTKSISARQSAPVFSPAGAESKHQCAGPLLDEASFYLQFAEKLHLHAVDYYRARKEWVSYFMYSERTIKRLKSIRPSNDEECRSFVESCRYLVKNLMDSKFVLKTLLDSAAQFGCGVKYEVIPYSGEVDSCTPHEGQRITVTCQSPDVAGSFIETEPICERPYEEPSRPWPSLFPLRENPGRPSGADFKGEPSHGPERDYRGGKDRY